MSLSLSSLLNPSPDIERPPTPPPQGDALPPNPYVQSPEQHRASISPTSSRLAGHAFVPTAATTQEAAHALATLSHSPPPAPTQWQGYGQHDQYQLERQRSGEWRPGSGYGDPPIHLPPPPSAGSGASRKMSSPTLEHYQLASRSPEQRRASIISPSQSGFTLPPLQGFAPPSFEGPSHTTHRKTQLQYASAEAHAPLPRHEASLSESGRQGMTEIPAQAQSPVVTVPKPQPSTSDTTAQSDRIASSPAVIKQETIPTPQPSSPVDARRPSDADPQTVKAVTSLKNEHGLRNHSPLRDASVPILSTEDPTQDSQPTTSKKRPAPSKMKKGTATTMKKGPPSKKWRIEIKRDATPSSHTSKFTSGKGSSLKGTPVNSSPAPSTRSMSIDPNEDTYDDEDDDMDDDGDGDVYCVCRKPDNGTFMIGCDGTCDDWFHGKCVGIEERDKNLIDKYLCPSCTKAGVGRTTWKRMCRRSGCRQPAKVGKHKNGTSGSKYCSEECGVLFFKDMVAKTRGREDHMKSRASRRKASTTNSESMANEDDIGARGGVLAAGEVKALLDGSKNLEEFKKLGDGVLSPPATPDGGHHVGESQLAAPEMQALLLIQTQKEDARRRHALLKDRMKFINLVKQAANRTAAERDLKLKDYCGYDSRLEFIDEEFQDWRSSNTGQRAFELDTLATEKTGSETDRGGADFEICEVSGKKKCSRHLEWAKLAVDGLRMEMGENGDRMRALDREEKNLRERASIRAKAGANTMSGEGSVEVHGLGISTDDDDDNRLMNVDGGLTPPDTARGAGLEDGDAMEGIVAI